MDICNYYLFLILFTINADFGGIIIVCSTKVILWIFD